MSPLILALGGRKDKYTAKRKEERHSNASVNCNSELAFIYRDHWWCVGKGSVGLCSAVVFIHVHGWKHVQENSHRVLKIDPSSVFIYVITRMLTLNKLLSRVIIILSWCGLHVKLETIQQLIIQFLITTGITPKSGTPQSAISLNKAITPNHIMFFRGFNKCHN